MTIGVVMEDPKHGTWAQIVNSFFQSNNKLLLPKGVQWSLLFCAQMNMLTLADEHANVQNG